MEQPGIKRLPEPPRVRRGPDARRTRSARLSSGLPWPLLESVRTQSGLESYGTAERFKLEGKLNEVIMLPLLHPDLVKYITEHLKLTLVATVMLKK